MSKPTLRITESGRVHDQFYHAQASSRAMGLLMHRSLDRRRSKHSHVDDRFTDAEISFAGNLIKQGSFWRTWRKRYFILRNDRPLLCYYSSSKELTKLGEMTLDAHTLVEATDANSCYFTIKTNQRKLVLNATEGGVEYMHRWIDALHLAIASCRSSVPFAFKTATPITDHDGSNARGRKSSPEELITDDTIAIHVAEVVSDNTQEMTVDYRASLPSFTPQFLAQLSTKSRDDDVGMRRTHSLNDMAYQSHTARSSEDESNDINKPLPSVIACSWTDRNRDPSMAVESEAESHYGFGLNCQSLSLVHVRPPKAFHFCVSFGSIEKVPHGVQLFVVLSSLNWEQTNALQPAQRSLKKEHMTEIARTEVECTNHLRLCGDQYVRDFQALLALPVFLVDSNVVLQFDVYIAANEVTEQLKYHKLLGYFTIASTDLVADSEDGTPLRMDLRRDLSDGKLTSDILGNQNFIVLEQVASFPIYEMDQGYTFATHEYLVDSATHSTLQVPRTSSIDELLAPIEDELSIDKPLSIRASSEVLVTEEMSASYFSLTVVMAFVQMLLRRNALRMTETYQLIDSIKERDIKRSIMTSPHGGEPFEFEEANYSSLHSAKDRLQYYEGLEEVYAQMERRYAALVAMVREGAEHGVTSCLKRSTMKKDPSVEFMPTNLVCHLLRAQLPNEAREQFAWAVITHGCAAAHVQGFKEGGLRRMLLQHPTSEEITRKLEYRQDVVNCQLLGIVTTAFMTYLQLAADDLHDLAVAQLNMISRVGFLTSIESLLSTAGGERAMLEDMVEGVKWINQSVSFNILSTEGDRIRCSRIFIENREGVVVHVTIPAQMLAKLPLAFQQQPRIKMFAVLFTQGINEMQLVANTVGDTSIQEDINAESMVVLSQYINNYMEIAAREREDAIFLPLADIQTNFALLIATIESQKKNLKNINVLIDSSHLCRLLGAARTTCCKSGKDRTAMSVTLEFTRLLVENLGVKQGMCLCQAMRERGVRRTNVFVNTGKTMYAFNSLQLKCLPSCYKPPASTANAHVAS